MEFENGESWYSDAKHYWDNISSDIDGMLGGYGEVDKVETEQSSKLIQRFIDNGMLKTNCVCGFPMIK